MIKNHLELSIVVVNYRTSQLLQKLIPILIREIEDLRAEILIVDNSCSFQEKSSLFKLKASFPQLKLLINEENLGFARACNLGAKTARGKYIIFMNADVLPLPESVKALIKCAEETSADAVSPKLFLDPECKILHPPFVPMTFLHMLARTVSNRAYLSWWKRFSFRVWRTEDPIRLDFLTGAVFMVRKELAAFDEDFPLYFEDAAFFIKLKKMKARIFLCPSSRMVHLYDASPSDRKNFFWRISEKIFLKKYMKNWQRSVLQLFQNFRSSWAPNAVRASQYKPQSSKVFLSVNKDFIPFAYGEWSSARNILERFPDIYVTEKL